METEHTNNQSTQSRACDADSVTCSAVVDALEAELSKAEKARREAWLKHDTFEHQVASDNLHALERVVTIMRGRASTEKLKDARDSASQNEKGNER